MRANRPKTGATIVDIARKLGVSAMTVSRALTGSSEVSEKTREKVTKCAERMGYRPHRWARSLVTRRSSMVGVVVPDFSHSYFAEITHGIDEVLGKAGYNLLLCDSWMDPAKEQAEIEMLVGSRVDGLIVASEQPERSPEVFKWLEENRVPFVLVDRFFIGQDYSAVRVDDLETGRLATRHLVELGHRRIAHIRGPRLSPASLRYRGYLETLRGQGIEIRKEYIAVGRFDIESGRAAMQKLLALTPRPTAVSPATTPWPSERFTPPARPA